MAERPGNDDHGRRHGSHAGFTRWSVAAAVAVFFVLATANAAGYRFGTADQAFYIPAILHALDPASFPRDAAVVVPQSELLASDQLIAWMMARGGMTLPGIFLAGYLLTCAIFAVAVIRIGTTYFTSATATWTLLIALTLRHRIAETGVNTFEGSFHPRVLAFALGLAAMAALLRTRAGWAVGLVAAGFVVHPTTALWFSVWLAGAALAWPAARRWVVVAAAVALPAAAWMLWWGPLAHSMRAMDAAWLAPLATKDYLFPTSDWSVTTWLVNALAPVVLVGGFAARARRGLVTLPERAVFTGALALLGVFAASLPFVAGRLALAVQLQTSRVLWPIEFLATVYLVWLAVEAGSAPGEGRATVPRRARLVLAVVVVAACARGAYTLRVEHHRPLVAYDLPATAWIDLARWARDSTALDAHFLADPGHAWKYDVSVRVAAERDVFLEEVKDAAMAVYAREIALRVTERTEALGDFSTLTPERAVALAARYDLDFLIADRPFPFPIAHANRQFTVYALPR
jgi:hypothetical protein